MFEDILKQVNWVDIFILIILFRGCYIALKNGFPAEVFKLLGITSAIYFSLHYYSLVTDFIQLRILSGKFELPFLSFLVFIALAALGNEIFIVLRKIFYKLIKLEAVSKLNRWGGLILGTVRGCLTASLIVFILVMSDVEYLKNSVSYSYLGRIFFKASLVTYSWLWDNLASKFMPSEKFNQSVLQLQESLAQK
jgi:uncharacterized membrane protein required for colicin V production